MSNMNAQILANPSRDIPITTEYENFYLLARLAHYVNVQVMFFTKSLGFFLNKKGLYIDFEFTSISMFTVM